MTLQEMANEVLERLNLSSPDAEDRVKRGLNAAYRKITSSLGLPATRRSSDASVTVANDAAVTFDLQKVERVYITVDGQHFVLDEDTYDNVKRCNLEYQITGLPQRYAVQNTGTDTVTVILTPIPGDVYTITADGDVPATELGDNDSPTFPADFHDALISDCMRVEYLKKEKPALAKQCESDYRERLSDLRFYIIKSSSLAIVQGGQHRRPRNRTNYRLV